MFGFLPAPCGCFSSDEKSQYRAHFCGLANTLRGRYGLWSRWLVNRDAAFLSLLGSALSPTAPAVSCATCCNPFGKPRALVQTAPHVDYAAAVTVCGVATKLRDDAEDESGLRGRLSTLGETLVRSSEAKALQVLQESDFPVHSVLTALHGQSRREQGGGADLMDAVQPTRAAYGDIFGHLPQVTGAAAAQAVPLRQLGENLGTLIYLTDAWEDHAEDRRRGRFNPLPDDEASRGNLVGDMARRCFGEIASAFGALRLQGSLSLTQHLLLVSMPAAARRRLKISAAMDDMGSAPEGSPVPGGKKSKGASACSWCDACDCCDCCDGCDGCSGCDCG